METETALTQPCQPMTEVARIEYKRLEGAWCKEWARAENYRDIAEATIAFLEQNLQALKESEQRYRGLVDSLPQIVFEIDERGNLTFANRQGFEITGYTQEDLDRGLNIVQLCVPDDRDRTEESIRRVSRGEKLEGVEFTALKKDGSTFPVSVYGSLVVHNGQSMGLRGIAIDITERKRVAAETAARARELAASEEKYRRLLGDINDGYLVIQDEKVIMANERAVEIYGVPLDQFVGSPLGSSLPPEGQQQVRERFRRRIAGEAEPERYELTTATGITVEVNAKLIEYEGKPAVSAVVRDISGRKQAEEALKNAALETLDALSQLVEAADPYTAGHSAMVAELALKLAREMGLGEDQLAILRIACPLHDVGKVGIPSSVLNKPAKLTQAEWSMIHAHPVVSAQTAERVSAFKDAVPAILHHHERWDGTGYPDGLKGEEIPLVARILAVADGFEAMTSDRPYRRAFSAEGALAELKKGAGTQWDPAIVGAFMQAFCPKPPACLEQSFQPAILQPGNGI